MKQPTKRDQMLAMLARTAQPLRAAEIAWAISYNRRIISSELAAFIRHGWVARHPEPAGTPGYRYTLTEAGHRHVHGEATAAGGFGGDGGCTLQSAWR